MANQKLTDRTLASGVTFDDLIHIVITGDTTQFSGGSSYKATIGQVMDTISASTIMILGNGVGSTERCANSNNAYGDYSTVSGGYNNSVLDNHSTIGGGCCNNVVVGGNISFIGGGSKNTVFSSGSVSVIVGGGENSMSGSSSFIGGGTTNVLDGSSSFIGGGSNNYICGNNTTISGGYANSNSGYYASVIGGGSNNYIGVSLGYNTINGGICNTMSGLYTTNSTIIGGNGNLITGSSVSTIAGSQNFSFDDGDGVSILGGVYNGSICSQSSIIGDGTCNTISGTCCSIIVGGHLNTIQSSSLNGILGGSGNTLTHNTSFIVGSGITSSCPNTTYVNCLSIMDLQDGSVGLPSGSVYYCSTDSNRLYYVP